MTTKKKGLLRMKEINDAMPTPFVTEDSARTSSTEMRSQRVIMKNCSKICWKGSAIVDGEGNILFANEKLARILGCEVAEILKENISAVVIPSQKSQLERLRRYLSPWDTTVDGNGTPAAGCQPRPHAHLHYPFMWRPEKKDAVMILVLDITKRKRIEEDLAQAEKKYRNIFENSVDGLFQSNSRDELISANPAMAHIFGYSSTSEFITAVNSRKQTLYADSKYDRKLKSLLRRQDSVYNFEFRAVQRLGKQIWINENIHSVREERGNLLYYEGTLQDITEKKHLENELFQSKKMEAIGRIAGGIAHDFNNILTAIMGNAAMGERCLDPRSSAAKRIQAIKDAADQAGQLTRQLLSISRKQKVHPVLMNLNSSVISVGKILERILGEDIDLNVALNENLKSIYADPSQIEQVILNLSVNARDAMNQGGRLSISTENVNLNQEFCRNHPDAVPGEYVRLSVSDTGTGIPKESL
jgi:PAS domain S-box-containing protein